MTRRWRLRAIAAKIIDMLPANTIDSKTLLAIRQFMELVDSRFPTAGAILFGSRARGDHQPQSDADLAVLLEGEHLPRLPTAMAMADAAYDVLLSTGVNISPVPVWVDQWEHPERFPNPALLASIARV